MGAPLSIWYTMFMTKMQYIILRLKQEGTFFKKKSQKLMLEVFCHVYKDHMALLLKQK